MTFVAGRDRGRLYGAQPGDRVTVTTHSRFGPARQYPGTVTRITPAGLIRIRADDGRLDELFYPDGRIRTSAIRASATLDAS